MRYLYLNQGHSKTNNIHIAYFLHGTWSSQVRTLFLIILLELRCNYQKENRKMIASWTIIILFLSSSCCLQFILCTFLWIMCHTFYIYTIIKKIMNEGGLVPFELTVNILINALIANPSKVSSKIQISSLYYISITE